MADREENSALIALAELRNLEAERVAGEEAKRRAKEEAERRAREEAERKAREEAERIAKEEAARLAAEQAAREAREREERLRLQEAELRTRAEQEARLREEQMRLDAQIKMTEKKARPLWLTVTPIVLGVLLIGGVIYGKSVYDEQNERAEADRIAAQRRDEEQRKLMETLTAQLNELKGQQEKLEKERAELEGKLDTITDEAERAKIQAEIDKRNAALAENESKQKKASKAKTGGSSGSSGSSGSTTPKKPAIEVKKTDDPLDGL